MVHLQAEPQGPAAAAGFNAAAAAAAAGFDAAAAAAGGAGVGLAVGAAGAEAGRAAVAPADSQAPKLEHVVTRDTSRLGKVKEGGSLG